MKLSDRFAAELTPRRHLRALVILCGAAAAAAGVFLIVTADVTTGIRTAATLAWLLFCRRDVLRQYTGYRRVRRLRIEAAGTLTAITMDHGREILELMPGSIVLTRVAWLHLRFADGTRYGELLTGRAAENPDWHHLRLIWELRRSAFGGADRS